MMTYQENFYYAIANIDLNDLVTKLPKYLEVSRKKLIFASKTKNWYE